MMEKCNECMKYYKEIDMLPRDACILEGQEDALGIEEHMCLVYNPIPEKIMLDKVDCKYWSKRIST